MQTSDGSAGDADYRLIGVRYADHRCPDPRIAAVVHAALGSARSVLNVGAGAGSYEPTDRDVTAVEPSASMRAQGPPGLPPAIDATAERLPFPDNHFDAVMSTFSVHQWRDPAAGLGELRRVSRGPVVILSCDPALVDRFWLNEFAPEVIATEARRYPTTAAIAEWLGGPVTVSPVPIPLDCTDGFNEAYYGRPERLLDPAARRACSAWSFVPDEVTVEYVDTLARSLADGSWDRRYGYLRRQPWFNGSLILVTAGPGRADDGNDGSP